MINIWDFRYVRKVSIKTIDGQVYEGSVVDASSSDENDTEEDIIDVELSDGRIIGFTPSDILSIIEIT